MSKPLEGVSEKIEACAKKEFLEKGYVDLFGILLRMPARQQARFIPGMVEKKDFLVQLLSQ